MRTRSCVLLAACAHLLACGSSDSTSLRGDTGGADGDHADTNGELRDAAGDVAADLAPVEVGDEVPVDAAADPGGDVPAEDTSGPRGAPCTSDDECAPLVCYAPVAGDARGVCVAPCAEVSQCADDELCQLVSSAGGDTLRVCIPEGLCLDDDGDGYGFGAGCVGPDCDESDPLVYLGAPEACDGVDNNCDEVVDNDVAGLGVDCASGFAGVCGPGRLSCSEGALLCAGLVASSDERCDGLDNDCDGATDEDADGAPLARPCYAGPLATRDVGECRAGLEVCLDGAFATCSDQVLPLSEVCDGADNNCDGVADDGNPSGGMLCATGRPGECAAGVTQCTEGSILCVETTGGRAELCDGVDNNCDGVVDDGNPGGGGTCGTGRPGVCAEGVITCSAGALICEQAVASTDELCDGLDNNCDGRADEENPGGGGACATGRPGVCSDGVLACGGGAVVCSQLAAAAGELCDGLDNDCDGTGDDGCPTGLTLTSGVSSPQYGGGGGTAYAYNCPAGSALVGLFGRYGSEIDAIGPRCAPLTLPEDRTVSPYRYRATTGSIVDGPQYGGSGGAAFSSACPAGQVVIGVNVRAAARLDRVQWVCGSVEVTGNPGALAVARGQDGVSPAWGGSGGDPYSYLCPSNQLVTGIFGRSGGRVDAFGVRCSTPGLNVR